MTCAASVRRLLEGYDHSQWTCCLGRLKDEREDSQKLAAGDGKTGLFYSASFFEARSPFASFGRSPNHPGIMSLRQREKINEYCWMPTGDMLSAK